ncbi:MAG TPA: Stp1/IreP family PP2C-type Ser/Thr phosphatase [Gaiellaceae bacterium]|nr:Stp1/IreP family PP2C-type Ser/Thr phosphatase [Gaiellaceae bacterium]
MRVGETAGKTDAGRKRRRNEDAFVVEPPLFAVADGMGGAQAGEVASRLAAAAFREFHEADELAPEDRVRAIVQEANRRIYDRARSDAGATGMGTTVTAALVEPGQIAIAHVGDSRAYRVREGRLEQLTEDHSLVADLMRSGRLTAEEAETHPQRSVITRALGTDPEVDVDTLTVEASPGDVFLLCSDGLTTMVADDDILELVSESPSLEAAAAALVKAANRGGGEDNVTVVLFAVEGGEAGLEETLVAGDGRGSDDDLEDTLAGLEVPASLRASETTITAPPEEAGWPREEAEEADEPEPAPGPRRPRRRRWRRRLLWAALVLAFVLLVLAGALWGLSRAYFVGADEEGNVTVFQGLPYDVSDDVGLYRARYVSRLHASQLSAGERTELFDHELLSYDEARARVDRYELEVGS